MADRLPKHPALMLRDLLLKRWDASNTSGLDPNIAPHKDGGLSMNRGWYSTVDFDPHVALVNFREPISNGGNSGYTGIDPSGDGPTQLRLGNGTISIFAEGDREYGSDALDADTIAYRIQQEIENAIMDAETDASQSYGYDYGSAYGAPALPGPWLHVSSAPQNAPNDTDVTPTVFRENLRAQYSWQRMP